MRRILVIGAYISLIISIILFVQGKSFVPTACYFLILSVLMELIIVESKIK